MAERTRAEPMKRTVGFALDGEEPAAPDVRLSQGSPFPVIIPPILQAVQDDSSQISPTAQTKSSDATPIPTVPEEPANAASNTPLSMSVSSICSDASLLQRSNAASVANSPCQRPALVPPKSQDGEASSKGEGKAQGLPAGEKPKLTRAERREIQ
eukprot:CAMPEP_0118934560 /NCGR_PEP_ID=MMETSP1169-20130426/13895_1 /TAXON_ID=36882 /ORGANISM="Pyramimonas obovata, Strain CCMP722" /LENGTH=154 /DNA_ID=CAMNT_0006877479 /DNA_START=183 /DNA_END=644 /DNA_ORIENTATION=+